MRLNTTLLDWIIAMHMWCDTAKVRCCAVKGQLLSNLVSEMAMSGNM